MLFRHGADLLVNLAAVLMEKLVRTEGVHIAGAAEDPEIRPDVAGKLRHRLCAENVVAVKRRAGVGPLHNGGGCNIAKDKMAVTVAIASTWEDISSGLISRTQRAVPAATISYPRCRAKVAAEQATSMSKPKPLIPSSFCTSMAMAGYARWV